MQTIDDITTHIKLLISDLGYLNYSTEQIVCVLHELINELNNLKHVDVNARFDALDIKIDTVMKILGTCDCYNGITKEICKDGDVISELVDLLGVTDARCKELLELSRDKFRDEYNFKCGVANGLRIAISKFKESKK